MAGGWSSFDCSLPFNIHWWHFRIQSLKKGLKENWENICNTHTGKYAEYVNNYEWIRKGQNPR